MTHSTAGILVQPAATTSKGKAFTIAAHIARVILGAIFLVFGLNGFFHFITMPPPAGTAGEFVYGLVKAAYFLPFMAAVQVLCGALLLSGTLIPLALLLLFPITLNIFLFHLALAPEGLGMAVLIMAAHVLLAVYYWPVFKTIFQTQNAWTAKRA